MLLQLIMLFLQLLSLLVITCDVSVFYVKYYEIINKHVLAYVCYYSFCNEILMIHVFFSKVQIFFKSPIPGIPIDVVAVNYAVFAIVSSLIITCDVLVFYVKYIVLQKRGKYHQPHFSPGGSKNFF
jgi:hypothetical protein